MILSGRLPVSSILVTCKNKSGARSITFPPSGPRAGLGPSELVAPGDPLPRPGRSLRLPAHGRATTSTPATGMRPRPSIPPPRWTQDRDALEIPLVREAWQRKLPILGICRGEQVLNVALGGSMVQDVPDHYGCEPSRAPLGHAGDPATCATACSWLRPPGWRALLGEDVVPREQPPPPGREARGPPSRGRGLAPGNGARRSPAPSSKPSRPWIPAAGPSVSSGTRRTSSPSKAPPATPPATCSRRS